MTARASRARDTLADMRIHGPERLAGQGLDPEQEESGNRAILALLTDPEVAAQMDLVLTWRAGEGDGPAPTRSGRRAGWCASSACSATTARIDFEVIEVDRREPGREPGSARARARSPRSRPLRPPRGFDAEDPGAPLHRARAAELPVRVRARGPALRLAERARPRDLAARLVSGHPARHARRAARAPVARAALALGPGRASAASTTLRRARGGHRADLSRGARLPAASMAPTRRAAPPASAACAPDVYLARQDGRVLEEILAERSANARAPLHLPARRPAPDRARGPPRARARRAARACGGCASARRCSRSGSIVTFPSITWPSHTTIGTGAWCGHHDVVNPTYYLREKRETVSPQGQQVRHRGLRERRGREPRRGLPPRARPAA